MDMTLVPTPSKGPRARYRPPIGIPMPNENNSGSVLASVLFHALIIFLLIGPIFVKEILLAPHDGAGDKGPVGGGGGGGAPRERATYVEVAPPPPAVKSTQPQLVTPPVVKPPDPTPQPPAPEPAVVVPPAPAAGAGTGGTGTDGLAGTGPGRGGGVGSGDGSGRGSANGPGTGGSGGRVYPPTVTHLAMLPLPVPSKVRPYTLVAIFEVDETGKAKLLQFNESRDAGYNKKIRAMLEEIRFRPAVRADGTPVRDTTSITAEARL